MISMERDDDKHDNGVRGTRMVRNMVCDMVCQNVEHYMCQNVAHGV